MKMINQKILITGGASGIGFAMAERFIADGNTVIICGRRADALENARQKLPSLLIKQCDLSSAEEREALFSWVKDSHPDLNVVVNNAGIQNWMSITDANFFRKAKEEIGINIEAVVHLCTLFTQMESIHTVMNVTSGLSFSPLAKVPVYCATKAFMHSFTLSLRHLLRPKNIKVIELIPPALNTDLGGKGIHDFAPPVSAFIDAMFAQLAEGKEEITFGLSEQASKAGPEQLKQMFERMNPIS
jgi:uncharacterized oxidoreductase